MYDDHTFQVIWLYNTEKVIKNLRVVLGKKYAQKRKQFIRKLQKISNKMWEHYL